MKKKILMIADHPFSPSGVAHQTRLVAEALLKTGMYKIISIGGAIKHENYNPSKTEQWGDDWLIFPTDGYGTQEMIRSIVRTERIDAVYFMSDPRFYGFLVDIDNEIRSCCPMIWYGIWDNLPDPTFNRSFYLSIDMIVSISKISHGIIQRVAPEVETVYLPHSVDSNIFKKLPEAEVTKFKEETFIKGNPQNRNKFIFFFNSRSARRKQSGSMIFWFKKFLDIVGHDKACLLMHCNPKDEAGQDLEAIIQFLGLTNGEVLFSKDKIPQPGIAMMYNMIDCTLLFSNAEGFGISISESLACEKPCIATKTGGIQDQLIGDDGQEFGICIPPAAQSVVGSLEIPWIFEDHVSEQQAVDAMLKIYNMTKEERDELGKKGREHLQKHMSFSSFEYKWQKLFHEVIEKHGSWESRKNFKPWKAIYF